MLKLFRGSVFEVFSFFSSIAVVKWLFIDKPIFTFLKQGVNSLTTLRFLNINQ
jgi:hypothetical protein